MFCVKCIMVSVSIILNTIKTPNLTCSLSSVGVLTSKIILYPDDYHLGVYVWLVLRGDHLGDPLFLGIIYSSVSSDVMRRDSSPVYTIALLSI